MKTAMKRRESFSPHQFAVYRHVWTLNETERKELDRCFMLQTTGSKLLAAISTEHQWKDLILNKGIEYELVYQECSNEMLETTLSQKPILLSFRYHAGNNMAVCLVKQPFSKADLTHYKELVL